MDIHTLVEQALDIFDCELDIVRMELEHPERFADAPVPAPVGNPKPTLCLIPEHRALGVMGMTEILTGIQLLEGFRSSTGKKATTIAHAEAIEQTLGFSFNDIYDRQIDLFKRKACNLTKTLDAMKAVLMKEYRRRQAEKDNNTKGEK